jgi:hypothetical protein
VIITSFVFLQSRVSSKMQHVMYIRCVFLDCVWMISQLTCKWCVFLDCVWMTRQLTCNWCVFLDCVWMTSQQKYKRCVCLDFGRPTKNWRTYDVCSWTASGWPANWRANGVCVLGLRLDEQPKTDVHRTSVLGLRLDNQPSLYKYLSCSHNLLHLTTPAPIAAVGHFHDI